MEIKDNWVIVISGPTCVGKSSLSLQIADELGCPIISADSRQVFKELNIGTAKPSKNELERVKHYFINHLPITERFSAGIFENESIPLLNQLFKNHRCVILTGGTGFYIDALLNGIEEIPDIPQDFVQKCQKDFEDNGLEWLSNEVKKIDPRFFSSADIQNPRRLIRALTVSQFTGKAFSTWARKSKKSREFNNLKILLERDRSELYERINKRVDQMIENGLLDEAQQLFKDKGLSSLQTVGYQELFEYFEGKLNLDQAIEKIKRNTRRYAKRQMTWFRRDKDWNNYHPDDFAKIKLLIQSKLDQ